MSELQIAPLQYPPSGLQLWKDGCYEMLAGSKASPFLKRILIEKARTRREGRIYIGRLPDRRFFGEAFVAAHLAHDEGWYASFKWLTSPRWTSHRQSSRRHRVEFERALGTHILNLGEVQTKALELREALKSKKPVAPDLWLIDSGTHRFIEVKLPGDTISDPQLAGLAIIATCVRATGPVSVEIIQLRADVDASSPSSERDKEVFSDYCRALGSG